MTTPLQLVQVAPADLGVRDQAREDATPDEQLIASIRKHGIIQPPVIEQAGAGYVIVTGHRRVGAAIAAGLTEISCILREAPLDGEAITLEQQIVENERRKQLSAKDLAAGYEKLALFGLRPEDIAAGLGEKTERIRAGLRVNASKQAADLVAQQPTIDLERAAVIAEFDDHPKLQQKLIETATTRPENFARDLESARSQREVDNRVAKLKAELDADGILCVGVSNYDHYYWRGDGTGATLTRLGIRVEEHTGCPGHAVVITKAQSYYLNTDPSEWILYVCTDWEGNGHTDPNRTGANLTPEEIEERAERERQREQDEAERRAREEVITANTTARREWITAHLTTGRLRPAAAHFDLLAAALRAEIHHEEGGGERFILQMLDGRERPRPKSWQDHSITDELLELIESGRVPALRLALARAFAYFEESRRFMGAAATGYWPALTALGYILTDTDAAHRDDAIASEAEWFADRAGEDLTGDPVDPVDEDDEGADE